MPSTISSPASSGHNDPDCDERLLAIASDLLRFAPPVQAIASGKDPGRWAEELRALVQHPYAEPFRADIEAIIAERFRPTTAISHFYDKHRRLPMGQIVAISTIAAEAAATAPLAAFILSTLCLFLVAGQLEMLQTSGPTPHWSRWYWVSYACLTTSAQVGALWPARRLVDFTYNILDATKMMFRPDVEDELRRCRDFARTLERKLDIAISNLADDLRESCRPGQQHFRAEVGAMAWTLGMVPESAIFRAGSPSSHVVPSRRFFRQIVRHSLVCMPTDALLQYVWLELKDRGPFDLRSHEVLFTIINNRYAQSPLESFMLELLSMGEPPARRYARALIGLFRGDLDDDEGRACGAVWYHLLQQVPMLDTARAYLLLCFLSGAPPRPVPRELVDDWMKLLTSLRDLRRNRQMDARGDPLLARGAVPRFYLADALQSAGRTAELLDHEEEWRTAALSYWLAVTPPRLTDAQSEALADDLKTERELETLVRGAYFEMLYPSLPDHYRRFAFTGIDPQTAPRPSARRGQARHVELTAQLKNVRDEMARKDGSYAAIRPDGAVGLRAIQELLERHRV